MSSEGRLVNTGSVVYAPLFYPDRFDPQIEPFGVIRISKAAGEKPFKEVEVRLFLAFAQKLSRAIINSKFMSLLNKFPGPEISESERKESFRKIMKQAAEFVGGRGCSLFLFRNNHLKLYSSYGNLEEQTVEPYPLGKGYTGWVGLHKEHLLFNDPKELAEWNEPLTHSKRQQCETENAPPDKFLAVPIVNTTKNLLGVLRTAKTATDTRFTSHHRMIFVSLASRFSPLLESISTMEKFLERKQKEMEQIFMGQLIEKCTSFKEGLFCDDIKMFFDIQPLDERPVADRIFESVELMWNKIHTPSKQPSNLLKIFAFFNKKFLEELPYYRDHFIHQYQVFLLGSYIIHELRNFSTPFGNVYAKSLKLNDSSLEDQERLSETAWLITSTFHDIASPLGELIPWLTKIINMYLGLDPKEETIVPDIAFEKIFTYTRRKSYLKYVDELIEFTKRTHLIPPVDEMDFREWIQCGVGSKDHGVLAALILISSHPLSMEKIFYPSALAIALHKNLGPKVATAGKFNYSTFPLFFLLIYCDIVQEWGRKDEKVRLEDVCITDKISDISDVRHLIPDEIVQNNETVYILSRIVMADPTEKIRECDDWFKLLRSKNPYFCILINDEFYGSWPKKGGSSR